MISRCIWRLSSCQAFGMRCRAMEVQPSFLLSSRLEFSSSSAKKLTPTPPQEENIHGSKNNKPKVIFGGVLIGAAAIAAYLTGYGKLHVKDDGSSIRVSNEDSMKDTVNSKHPDYIEILHSTSKEDFPTNSLTSQSNAENANKSENNNAGLKIDAKMSETSPIKEESSAYKEEDISISVDLDRSSPVDIALGFEGSTEDILSKDSSITVMNSNEEEGRNDEGSMKQKGYLADTSSHCLQEADGKVFDTFQDTSIQTNKVSQDEQREENSLAESFSPSVDDNSPNDRKTKGTDPIETFFKDEEGFVAISNDGKKSGEVKLAFDFIEAIHAAEIKQAESDAYIFTEEKRKMKAKFENELKDARARELMYAEEAAMLEKEMNKEKVRVAATIKSIQELAEQKLSEELKRKEKEADAELMKALNLAKAELAAAIATEKSSQMEKIAEANLHINALCMAFYARSEEARQAHSVHKLALGTLALEDALSKGLPIRVEVEALYKALEGIDRESLLGLALSSLPEDTINIGINTSLQLNQKFDSLKGTLRHFSLIPAGGGGLLTHAVAHLASSIKMRENGSSDGVESLIARVETFLTEKNYAEAADALVEGVRGTEAEEVAVEWSRLAKNRAIAEQALSLLQSYALSIAFK